MKRLLFSFLAVIGFAIVLSSCSQNSPKPVAQKWLTSFYHMDYDAAKTVSTDETKKVIAIFQQLSVNSSDSDKQQLKKVKIQIKDVKTDGDKSTVTYVTSDNPKEQTIHLVKQNSKWLVQWTKQDQMSDDNAGGGAAGAGQQGADTPVDTTMALPAPGSAAGQAPDSPATK